MQASLLAPGQDLSGLGRLYVKDPRDRQYLMPRIFTAKKRIYRNWLTPGGVLDQGSTPQCVAYAGLKWLTTHRVVNRAPTSALLLYKECQRVDEWAGENYDGTSIRALFKVLQRRGLVEAYSWAFSLEPVVDYVLTTGPVVMGTIWTMDMFMPHYSNGYIWPSGQGVGGHAWLIVGANRQRPNPDGTVGAVRMLNSWGEGWGQKGKAWLTFGTLARLIEDDGEAAIATEIRA